MWKKKNQSSRNKRIWFSIFLLVAGLLSMQSCRNSADSQLVNSWNESSPTIALKAIPEKWMAKDTIRLLLKCEYKKDGARKGMRGISVPGAEIVNHVEQENDKHEFLEILFFPGMSYFQSTDDRYALCKCEWELPEEEIILSLQNRFLILQDTSGFYYFSHDEESYQLDTLYLD